MHMEERVLVLGCVCDIPSRVVSASRSSSSPRTGLEATEFRLDGGGVGRFDNGL